MNFFKFYIDTLLKLCHQAIKRNEIPISAIIVDKKTKKIISKSHNLTIANKDPLAHAEIIAIQKALKSTDRVTLYRTLQTLSDKGIIHKAANIDNEDYYAICGHSCNSQDHNHNHVHFKCNDCNTITCENMEEEVIISLPHYTIDSISININGKCKSCLKTA